MNRYAEIYLGSVTACSGCAVCTDCDIEISNVNNITNVINRAVFSLYDYINSLKYVQK